MQGRIEKLKPRYSFKLEIRDVDKEERWVKAYDTLVPVLLLDGDEVCHYHLDDAKLRRLLESA